MRTRKNYEPEFKKEIAEGYYTNRLSAQDIEAKGIRMNNVHRWIKQLYGPGGRRAKPAEQAQPVAPPVAPPDRVPPAPDVHTLSLRKLKRGANRRYRDKDKSVVMEALLHLPVPEVSEKTGVNPATLYLWRDEAQKQAPKGNGGPLVVVPEKHNNRPGPANHQVVSPSRAELLMNPVTTEAILGSIRKSEGFVNLEKVYKNRVSAYRAGTIDFDEDDHRFCMGFLQLTGGSMRGARR